MKPRLKQPLFSKHVSKAYAEAQEQIVVRDLIRAYDVIWTLLYAPADIEPSDRLMNAKINLDALGTSIEAFLGETVFMPDGDDERQLKLLDKNGQPIRQGEQK